MSEPDWKSEPDWDRIRQISDEMKGLIADGKWTKAEYRRLMKEAGEAVNGHNEFLEFLENNGEDFEDD